MCDGTYLFTNTQPISPEYLDQNTDWKYLNVYEVDKEKENKCGAYTGLRIYSSNLKKL